MTINTLKNKVPIIVQPILRRFRQLCPLSGKPCKTITNGNCQKLSKECCYILRNSNELLSLQDLITRGTPGA